MKGLIGPKKEGTITKVEDLPEGWGWYVLVLQNGGELHGRAREEDWDQPPVIGNNVLIQPYHEIWGDEPGKFFTGIIDTNDLWEVYPDFRNENL